MGRLRTLPLCCIICKSTKKKLLQLLGQGYTVKLLDLGLLKIKHRGKIKNASEAESIANFTLGFLPSKDALASVKELSVDSIVKADSSPVIESVTDVLHGAEDGLVTASQPVKLTGTRLKLGGENDRLYFVPQNELEQSIAEKQKWIEVEHAKIFRNKPTELLFFAPGNLAASTKYRIRIETSYLSEGKSRKAMLAGESGVVQLRE